MPLCSYLNVQGKTDILKLEEVREVTKKELAKRNDDWLLKSEPFFKKELTNNHCKWFQVYRNEANHRGQIRFLKRGYLLDG